MSVSFLQRPGLPSLAYQKQGESGNFPTIVFLPGLHSDMEGTKAVFLANHAAKRGQAILRFDYRGHGASEGQFEEGTIGLWLEDTLAAIDHLTGGRLILVGSSMGGWVGLLATIARPARVAGYIGIAAAPDFTRAVLAQMSEDQQRDIREKRFFSVPGDHGAEPMIFTRALLEDGERHCLLDHEIPIDCPVRLLQGMQDTEVPWQTAPRISNALRTPDKKVYLREHGDHRLSGEDDLALLASLVDELSEKA